MVGKRLTEITVKPDSHDACFQTAESTHSKFTNTPLMNIEIDTHLPSSGLLDSGRTQNHLEQSQNASESVKEASRLFTFMDELESHRPDISKSILGNQNDEKLKTKRQIKDMIGFQGKNKIFPSSKIKNHLNNNFIPPDFDLKIDRSQSKLSGLSRTKTPKQFLSPYNHKNSLVDKRSISKTPKFDRSTLSPRFDKQLRIIRAKSSLQKDFKRYLDVPRIQKYVLQQKNDFEIQSNPCARTLIKKKKQLQKQLNAINQSLMNCKKKTKTRPSKVKLNHLHKAQVKPLKKSTLKSNKKP